MLKLVEANERYMNQYKEAYLELVKKNQEGKIRKHNVMLMNPDEIDVVERIRNNRDESKLPLGYVPSYDYFLVDDNDNFLGELHIRIRLTDKLLRLGGHIGYCINPLYWKKGYGTEILRLGLEKAKDLVLDDKILVTCDDDNIGSYKIIEKNGGILENKVENECEGESFITRRYWIKNR